ncbi:hypothetical protein PVK06_033902 [Gossypium arboreum]|uniref:AAA-ATPase At3g50940-like n=1 Tax=Gossypium arboreum TaxID=29729 RepID=A0ABR0NCR7_GOSAR|nr:hypothetical protein PVK06_033902 [Gossypium arboreum]
MKTKGLLSTAASIAATAMVIRTITNDFIPAEITNYFSMRLRSLSHRFSSQLTIVIDEFRGHVVNQVFEAADAYLGTKTANPSIQRVKVGKTDKDNNLSLSMDRGGTLVDVYGNVEMKWKLVCSQVPSHNHGDVNSSRRSEVRHYELSFHKRNKDLVIDSYLPYILETAKLMREENKSIKLHTVVYGRWDDEEVIFKHPMTFNSLAMDWKLKRAVMEDLEMFTNGEEYYKKRTGKSSLIAAMANHLKYDIYDLDLTDVRNNSDLRFLLLSISSRSILVVEDIDCSIELENRESEEAETHSNQGDNQITLSGLWNVFDGLWSCCGEERIIIFTTNHKERLDPALVRPGRMDMHVHMSYCNASVFKQLAFNYFGIRDHGVFEQIEKLLEEVNVSPAEVAGELLKKKNNSNAEAAFQGLLKFLHEKKEKGEEETVNIPSSVQFSTISIKSSRGRGRGRRGRGRFRHSGR